MASAAVRSAFRASSLRSAAARVIAQAKPVRCPFRISDPSPLPPRIFRSAVAMSAGVESLLPLHSATASCRMTSMLSASHGAYGWLSEARTDDV